jgi:hypothetical protein
LAEAKGKNNLPPDVEGAKKADEWFKTIDGLKYKDSKDYISFPPFTIEMAKEEFKRDKKSAYKKEWVPYWYKKGIEELDLDLENKIKNNDIVLLKNNFGKYQLLFEKIKPVVTYWCNEYILNRETYLGNILFSGNNQYWKTYKKLGEMQLAAKVFAEYNPSKFLSSEIKNIEEYKTFIEVAEKNYPEKDSIEFLIEEADKTSKKDYIDIAAKNAAERSSVDFLYYFHGKPWAQPYLDRAARLAAEKNSREFLYNFHDKPLAEPYLDLAAKSAAERGSLDFLKSFQDKPWAQPYMDLAAKNSAENDRYYFIINFKDKDWANKPIESIGGMTWLEYAKSMIKKSSNNYKDSLIKLSNILMKMNLEKFSFSVKKLL